MPDEDDLASTSVGSSAPPNEPPTVVKFVLPDAYRDHKDHYAVANLPQTYQEATVEAVKLLGKYMIDPTPENTTLRCSTKNREGQWVWADIPPQDWEKMINRFGSNEVGVFENKRLIKKSTIEFVNGEVMLTCGKVDGSQLKWTELFHDSRNMEPLTLMCRPKNYKEAVDFVKDMFRRHGTWIVRPFYGANNAQRDTYVESLTSFKFFFFQSNTNTKTWIEFPPEAYTDDEHWRFIVPLPGSILGVIVE